MKTTGHFASAPSSACVSNTVHIRGEYRMQGDWLDKDTTTIAVAELTRPESKEGRLLHSLHCGPPTSFSHGHPDLFPALQAPRSSTHHPKHTNNTHATVPNTTWGGDLYRYIAGPPGPSNRRAKTGAAKIINRVLHFFPNRRRISPTKRQNHASNRHTTPREKGGGAAV